MIKKNPFTKILIRDKKQDFFHSSAYGKAQNGANIGVASTESFEKRQEIDANRQAVRRYNESQVGRNWVNRMPQATAITEVEAGAGATNSSGSGNNEAKASFINPAKQGEVKSGNAVAEARARFSTAPGRSAGTVNPAGTARPASALKPVGTARPVAGSQVGNTNRPNFKPNFGR